MSGTPTWPAGAETTDTRLADDSHAGQMARWAAGSATVATFAFSGAASRRRLYVPLATASAAGALSAADKAKLDLATLTADSGWLTGHTFATNWGNLANYPVRYRKLPDGLVILQGLAAKSAALALPETMLTLPAGYRPGVAVAGTQVIYSCASSGGYAQVRVSAAGVVSLEAGGSATWTSVGGISFYAEN